eukprot:jgi/Tetstr1/447696/TSEL_035053.t1
MTGTSGRNAIFRRRRSSPAGRQIDTEDDDSDTGAEARPRGAPPPSEHTNKLKSFAVRTVSTVFLIAVFMLFVYMGHVFLVGLIFAIQFTMVGELFKMARIAHNEITLRGFRAQQWYFFSVATFYMYGRFIKKNLWSEMSYDKTMMKIGGGLLRRHTLVSFSLYCAGFVMFVLSLAGSNKKMYLYQFGQYAWTHMILMTVFVPSSFFVSNTFEGLIWLILPSSLIIINDIAAYLAGFFFGRTPLIKLSPKKTWEGFIGGALGTVVGAFFLSAFLGQYKWLTCPRQDLSILGSLNCEDDPLYEARSFTVYDLDPWVPDIILEPVADLTRQPWVPRWLVEDIKAVSFTAQPVQLHACALAVFASLIGPFGGFFASGFKRAFKVKDFGDSIPGHGGVTDRCDCQMLMAVFSYLWYNNIIRAAETSVADLIDQATTMDGPDMMELITRLVDIANGEGLLKGNAMEALQAQLCGAPMPPRPVPEEALADDAPGGATAASVAELEKRLTAQAEALEKRLAGAV